MAVVGQGVIVGVAETERLLRAKTALTFTLPQSEVTAAFTAITLSCAPSVLREEYMVIVDMGVFLSKSATPTHVAR